MNTYELFKQLHHNKKPLIIANAWNAKSAQLIEENGFEAVATSSGAISNSLGYDDGEKIPFKELLFVIERMKAKIKIPLSVDFERGYTNDLNELTDNIQRLADIGVAGINIEDNQGEDIYLQKLYTIKNYSEKNNLKLFINARTDGFLQKVASPIETTIRLAKLYKDAGADGLFVPGISDAPIIKEISASIDLPLNVVATPALSSFTDLSDAGVKRISMAVFLYKATYNKVDVLLKNIKEQQSLKPLY